MFGQGWGQSQCKTPGQNQAELDGQGFDDSQSQISGLCQNDDHVSCPQIQGQVQGPDRSITGKKNAEKLCVRPIENT